MPPTNHSTGGSDCQASVLTAPGQGAIAVIALAGWDAARVIHACFERRHRTPNKELPIDQFALGTWRHASGTREEVVLVRLAQEQFEIQCHGGDVAVQSLLNSLRQLGVTILGWSDWLARVEPDPIVVEARRALAQVRVARAAAVLLDQLNGALRTALEVILAALRAGHGEKARTELMALRNRAEFGRHLISPWRVVFVGRPNVGKSSLMNALIGYERSLVDAVPGTTRDLVTAVTAIGGWPVEFADTAGLRIASNDIEAEGVQLTRQALRTADLAIFVRALDQQPDDREPVDLGPGPDSILGEERGPDESAASRRLYVVNKIDLQSPDGQGAKLHRGPSNNAELATSARTGAGIRELIVAMEQALVPQPPPAGAAVPFTASQSKAIAVALEAVERGALPAAAEQLSALLTPNRQA